MTLPVAIQKGYALALDNVNNVYVTGYQAGANANFLTIKYSQTVGIIQISNEVPSNFLLKQNFPNHFNPNTKIRFDITSDVRRETQDVRLIVYNSLGKEIVTLVNEMLSAGSYEVDFDAKNLNSGIYFYKLTAGEFSEIKKMNLIK